jgi:hypothetical protein
LTLCFGEYGGNVNLTINGNLRNVADLQELDGTSVGGVHVEVTDLGASRGLLALTGPIQGVAIGGQELWIDHVCTAPCLGIPALPCPGDTLHFDEVLFAPAAGTPQRVVLQNVGQESIQAAGMQFVASGGVYSLPPQLESIPPNARVVIRFDGLGPSANDYSFANDQQAVLHTGPTAMLGNPAGYCSLYRALGGRSHANVVDFVARGGEPGAAAADAVARRIWATETTHLWTDAANVPVGPGGWNLLPGDSIGRDAAGRWAHFPGSKEAVGVPLGVPQPIFPNAGAKVLESPARCTFFEVPGAVDYEVQIATDAGFLVCHSPQMP